MNKPVPFDHSALLVVKEGVDATLRELTTHLEAFLRAPVDGLEELGVARSELARLQGVCKMIHLDGVAVYCAELEKNLADLYANPEMVSPLHRDELRAAVTALTRYMDDLAQGADNATLRLFANYQQLQQMRGLEIAFELDLFFPDLAVVLPEPVRDIAQLAEPMAHLKAARTQYQLGLLRYLRQDDAPDVLAVMQQAVQVALSAMPQNESRAFWWVSGGLIDCVSLDGLPPELKAHKLLGRIDKQMRILVDGGTSDDQPLLNEILYYIGRSHSVSERVAEIKRVYALEKYLPLQSTLTPADLNRQLTVIAERLHSAEECWEMCVRGDVAQCEIFIVHTETIEQQSEKLEYDSLHYLAKQIAKAAQYASRPEHAQPLAMDMAMALQLLGKSVVHYRVLDSRFQEQARLLSERMQAAISGRRPDNQQFSQLVGLFCEIEKSDVLVTLSTEMLANLQQVEQNLNAYFNDAGKRAELHGLQLLLGQIQGCLRMLSQPEASQLLTAFEANIRNQEYGEGLADPKQSHALANALGTLEKYFQQLPNRQQIPVEELLAALAELNQQQQESQPVTIPEQAEESPAVELRGDEKELLEIFLEEAQEVMETLRANLKMSHQHPASHEPMVTIRRSFHTLKGSGRMVGLNELGEVAWAIERTLNKWLDSGQASSDALMNLIETAVQRFEGWIAALSRSGSVRIEAGEIYEMAKAIDNGLEQNVAPAAEVAQQQHPVKQAEAEEERIAADTAETVAAAELPSPEPVEPDQCEIGPVKISATLFKIGSEESKQHLATLQRELAELQAASTPMIQRDFMRAAHTLGGVNRAMGFVPVAGLAYALEGWLDARMDKPFKLQAKQSQMLDQVVAGMQQMVQDICDKQYPQPREDLVQRLLADKENLQVEEAPEQAEAGDIAAAGATGAELTFAPVPETALASEEADTLEYVVDTLGTTLQPDQQDETLQPVTAESEQEQDLSVASVETTEEPQPDTSEEQIEYIAPPLAAESASGEKSYDSVAEDEMLAALHELIVDDIQHEPVTELAAQLQAPDESIAEEAQALKIEATQEEEVRPYPPYVPPYIDPDFGSETAASDHAVESAVEVTAILPDAELLEQIKAAATTVQTESPKSQVHDDVDEQLLAIFMEEANDLCPKISTSLRAWRDKPGDEQHPQLLKRWLHTLKGSARMAGAMRVGEIAHEMEDSVIAAARLGDQAEYWDALEAGMDRINSLLEELRAGSKIPEPVEEHAAGEHNEADKNALEAVHVRKGERNQLGNMLRVRADMVDRLVNDAGEISVARSRMETELHAFKEGLLELTGSVGRLRKQLREVEIQAESQMQSRVAQTHDGEGQFDPLEFDRFTRLQELTRFMNESVHDVQTVQQTLLKNLDATSAALLAQARLNVELQEGLMSVRMVPFDSIADRLYRTVRQTGKELNKRANLEMVGGNLELDRSVLEKMTAPFEHLLRNAIAHGLENEEIRAQRGKRPIGEIRLSLRHEGNEVVFELSDDGGGLNLAALRAKAIASGILKPEEQPSEDQLAQLIFVAGISTSAEVSEVSGRGIGMDVVRSEIAALGGRVDVNSQNGIGARFIIHLPLTLAVTQTVMVRAGDGIFAIPSSMIEQVRQVKSKDMEALYRERKIGWQDRIYPLYYLPHILGDEEREPENQARNTVLLLQSAGQRIALHVDHLIGNQESVVKDIGPQLSRLGGIAGATVQGNGDVVLILNPIQMTQRIATAAYVPHQAKAEVPVGKPLVMVVDDSLTVRKITTRMLTRAGYQVVTAKDGVDALEQLAEISPAVMLLDVEMPRMDGFELTKQLRRDEKTRSLPIIMITSRTAAKHRDYALELGVNAYLGKPFQEDEVLQLIAEFVAAGKSH